MRAVIIDEGSLKVQERPDPVPGKSELLVRVHSAGLNGADLWQRAGLYGAPPGAPADIPGLELAGLVVDLGPGVLRFAVGDRVMAVVGGGAQAELATMHEATAMAVPDALGLAEAGGLPEVFTVAHDALFSQCELRPGERLLVNGGAGGVGVAAVQLGVTAGARVVASVRDRELWGAVEELGAVVVDPADAGAAGPYDVVLELVGAPNFESDLASLAIGGRITVIGVGAGAKAQLNLHELMSRRGRIFGSTLRARSLEERALAARRVEAQVLPLVEAGRVRVPVAASFRLEDVEAAYARFAAGSKLGKIILDATG